MKYVNRNELISGWKRIHGFAPPKGLSRHTMALAIAYQRQLNEIGRDTNQPLKCPSSVPAAKAVKPGARLIREWHGETHVVDVLESGFLWQEQIYSSLTKVAGKITGTHWSGPRFFGLAKRSGW
ncbi:MAG: DUF2924 domain-containing protein [Emcibacteraceae bacterium]|nr:DUF2924 domain-containing protein [Emcibacteraceae bacterium]